MLFMFRQNIWCWIWKFWPQIFTCTQARISLEIQRTYSQRPWSLYMLMLTFPNHGTNIYLKIWAQHHIQLPIMSSIKLIAVQMFIYKSLHGMLMLDYSHFWTFSHTEEKYVDIRWLWVVMLLLKAGKVRSLQRILIKFVYNNLYIEYRDVRCYIQIPSKPF